MTSHRLVQEAQRPQRPHWRHWVRIASLIAAVVSSFLIHWTSEAPSPKQPGVGPIGLAWSPEPHEDSRMLDDYDLIGIAVPTRGRGLITVWTATELLVSRDDGAEFELVRGIDGRVSGVRIDSRGVVVALILTTAGAQVGQVTDNSLTWTRDVWPEPSTPPARHAVDSSGRLLWFDDLGRLVRTSSIGPRLLQGQIVCRR